MWTWENLLMGVVSGVGEAPAYKVKLVNKSLFMLTDVKYVLYYCHKEGKHIYQTELEASKSPVSMIAKHSNSKDAEYAIRLSFDVPPDKIITDKYFFEFMITAKHSLTGSIVSITKRYTDSETRIGVFASGDSLEIIDADEVEKFTTTVH